MMSSRSGTNNRPTALVAGAVGPVGGLIFYGWTVVVVWIWNFRSIWPIFYKCIYPAEWAVFARYGPAGHGSLIKIFFAFGLPCGTCGSVFSSVLPTSSFDQWEGDSLKFEPYICKVTFVKFYWLVTIDIQLAWLALQISLSSVVYDFCPLGLIAEMLFSCRVLSRDLVLTKTEFWWHFQFLVKIITFPLMGVDGLQGLLFWFRWNFFSALGLCFWVIGGGVSVLSCVNVWWLCCT